MLNTAFEPIENVSTVGISFSLEHHRAFPVSYFEYSDTGIVEPCEGRVKRLHFLCNVA